MSSCTCTAKTICCKLMLNQYCQQQAGISLDKVMTALHHCMNRKVMANAYRYNLGADLEDVVQEAWMDLFRAIRNQTVIEEPYAYLLTCLRNQALKYYSRKLRYLTEELDRHTGLTTIERVEWLEWYEDMILHWDKYNYRFKRILTKGEFVVFELKFCCFLTNDQIADVLNKHKRTIENILTSIYRKLRDNRDDLRA